ncbi:variant erythrocyte surface antigen-1, alpha subunit [Babesia caballi]|uniref:Variant erythrocyte surface antigen-1, alpha subunit n=1 Tax=Babesia caballi TaxID=5871 RepID=A0AAV4M0S7_BABCB|nr:variant erythrocyte surface antigen-1, alpha subunit [Babesia caballi]
MSSQATGKSLTDRPSNLKEAIDWILRVTWKDGQVTGGTRQLAGAITRLLDGVQSSSPELEPRLNEIKEALSPGGTDGIIGALANGLEGFKNAITSNRENVYQVLNSGLAPEVPKPVKSSSAACHSASTV